MLFLSIPKALDFVESLAGTSALDILERDTNRGYVCLGLAASASVFSYYSPYPFATFAIASIGLLCASSYDYLQAKRTFLEKKIEAIRSESASRPKRALIIQSADDEKGALSMRTHVAKVRELAKTHSIERVVIKNKNDFLNSLPPGQFDLVWIRAHGKPTGIELAPGFELSIASSPRHFELLASKIKQYGKLLLECCNVANASQNYSCNIAQYIALYCKEATVYAPLTVISGIFGLEFDKWGYPHFYDGLSFRGKEVTQIIEGPEPGQSRF